MKNILERGLQWLSVKQTQYASSPILYCRNGERYPFRTVLGRTRYEIADENGFTVSAHSTDFLIEGLSFDPKTGDEILVQNTVYEVIDLGNGCWTWCEPHHIRRRIHTQLFKNE